MIPFTIMSLKINSAIRCESRERGREISIDASVMDMSVEGFCFRLSVDDNIETDRENCRIFLSVFNFREYAWREAQLRDYDVSLEEETEYYNVYRVEVRDELYGKLAKEMMKEYANYVNLKSGYSDAMLSQELLGYRASMEEELPESWKAQRRQWLELASSKLKSEIKSECTSDSEKKKNTDYCGLDIYGRLELGIALETHYWYKRFLEDDDFMSTYWRENDLAGHPLANKKVCYVYIGNQYCRFLFPDNYIELLDRAIELGLIPVIQFTDMTEAEVEARECIIAALAHWCGRNERSLEIIVNDYGMLKLVNLYNKDSDCFVVSTGALMNKGVRDPRAAYKKGMTEQELVNERRSYAQRFVSGAKQTTEISEETEKSSQDYKVWHVPFYQTNTSSYCTVRAQLENGSRALQQNYSDCAECHECQEKSFIYGDGLKLVGRYNSLFGYDDRVLSDWNELRSFNGRLVLNVK